MKVKKPLPLVTTISCRIYLKGSFSACSFWTRKLLIRKLPIAISFWNQKTDKGRKCPTIPLHSIICPRKWLGVLYFILPKLGRNNIHISRNREEDFPILHWVVYNQVSLSVSSFLSEMKANQGFRKCRVMLARNKLSLSWKRENHTIKFWNIE